ncbi:hypothetical protein ACFWXO_18775 [Kitasatospora sp. NPDC059088]|uniref:hypothetical protein n=1 Tax=Kitasatospora sp. NPDC059088 TaxID=3346722 RepID=UPI0036A3DA33
MIPGQHRMKGGAPQLGTEEPGPLGTWAEEDDQDQVGARLNWELTPLEGVGPLCFGMRINEVAAVLLGMTELRRFQADPSFREILGVEFGTGRAEPAVFAYFVDGRLSCVALDAVHGASGEALGRELTACIPADLERFLLHAHWCGVLDVSYGLRGNPGVNGLGLVLRVQDGVGGVATRPVMVGRAWADRCTDDWEGAIPECEWVGRQWAHPGETRLWPAEPEGDDSSAAS